LFAILTLPPIRIALSFTPAWHRMAKWLVGTRLRSLSRGPGLDFATRESWLKSRSA
jgi:hypothetical protein